MTYRDSDMETPPCPLCELTATVRRHDNPHQGRWLCDACMLLFDGTSGEWLRREQPEPEDITDELEQARDALKEAAKR